MARRTKDEAEQTCNAILDAAEAVFYRRGVVRTSLQEVAEAANVTRGAVYWHFRNKNELVQAMVERVILPQEHILEQLEASESDTPLQDLSQACRESLRQMFSDQQRRRVFTIITQRCEYVEDMEGIVKTRKELKERILGRFTRLFERAAKLGLLACPWTPAVAAATLHSLMFGLMLNIVIECPEADSPLQSVSDSCVASFFQALSV